MTLVDAHRAELRASGLTDETIARASVFSAPERQVRDILGYGAGAGLVFPNHSPNGSRDYARVKLAMRLGSNNERGERETGGGADRAVSAHAALREARIGRCGVGLGPPGSDSVSRNEPARTCLDALVAAPMVGGLGSDGGRTPPRWYVG